MTVVKDVAFYRLRPTSEVFIDKQNGETIIRNPETGKQRAYTKKPDADIAGYFHNKPESVPSIDVAIKTGASQEDVEKVLNVLLVEGHMDDVTEENGLPS